MGVFRSNNSVEQFHQQFSTQTMEGMKHPRLVDWIKGVQRQQKLTHLEFAEIALGRQKVLKAKFKERDQLLKTALEEYERGDLPAPTLTSRVAYTYLRS